MPQPDPRISELEKRLDELVRTQIGFQTEVTAIRAQLRELRGTATSPPATGPATRPPAAEPNAPQVPPPPAPPPSFGAQYEARGYETRHDDEPQRPEFGDKLADYASAKTEKARGNLEKFIGENLISKIGILVLILGVGIFAKYAIDSGWVSPSMRIIFGYAIGVALLGVAVRTKKLYRSFSAVLVSGGMAIMYFITYFAYAYYGLMPQSAAFIAMVLFTSFTVVAAILYDRQVIAHVGLVGAYAVPFLLSNDSGNYLFLFTYMALLNGGILAISTVRAWRPVLYTASAFTWVIVGAWFLTKFRPEEHLYLGLATLAVFFATFYSANLVRRAMHSLTDDTENLVATVATTATFYFFAFAFGVAVNENVDQTLYFTYVGIVSLAILITSYRFYGRVLAYVAYPLTWLIYGAWFLKTYHREQDLVIASVFAVAYFLIFYATTLFYRVSSQRISREESAGLLLSNSFVFYGFTYGILDSRESLRGFDGLLTVGHGGLHLLVASAVSRLRPKAIDVIQALTVLVITFSTMAVPVQFDGNAVTLIWSIEAAVLFYFGRRRSIWLFECLSYPVMVLAVGALAGDWLSVYRDRFDADVVVRYPFLNGDLVTAVVFTASFGFIYLINRKETAQVAIGKGAMKPFGSLVAGLAIFAFYNMIRMEIGNWFHMISVVRRPPDLDLARFNFVAQTDYTLLFLTAMAFVNLRKLRSARLGGVNVSLLVTSLLLSLSAGMFVFYELRQSYLSGLAIGLFGWPFVSVLARPFTYAFLVGSLGALYLYARDDLLDKYSSGFWRTIAFEAFAYPAVLIVLSCELMSIAAHIQINDAGKYGLSILWAVFALICVVIGIAKARKHVRIGAFVLLGATLLKLFLYDATDLPTIPKTILFVSIGLLMLGISFLYNKFRNVIFASVRNEEETDRI